MKQQKVASRLEQTTDLLRQGMVEGRWRGTLPGRERLATQLGCSHGTVEVAVRQLIKEGWLVSEGSGRRRRIEIPREYEKSRRQVKRVRILLYDDVSGGPQGNEILLLARLQEYGYAAEFAVKTLQDLRMDVGRVARFVNTTPSDAWIVCSASREILQWFSEQAVPAIAMFGRFSGLPIAATCPRKVPSLQAVVRRLVELGHQRIVLTSTPERVAPHPALFEQVFLDELQRFGLRAGSYNLPTIDEGTGGLRDSLRALFQLTPPTAIILGDGEHLLGTMQFLARRGLKVPEDISLISADYDTDYRWCDPLISHFRWELDPLVRHVLRWLDRVFQGKRDIRQQLFDAKFIEGGTVGPV